MTETPGETIRLADYEPPPFLIDRVDLRVTLDDPETSVHAALAVRRNPAGATPAADLVLDGVDLALDEVRLDGRAVAPGGYRLGPESLTVLGVPDAFVLETRARIRPAENTALEGLYKSGDTYCTQCEAEGFRKITWFLDRPDVMCRYTTTVVADRERCPVLLSNGNPIERGATDDGRHWVRWEDPFPKPAYLFALVAGDLACLEDAFTTRSGRDVTLRIYTEHHNRDRCGHAMASLKKAMAWDERVYGLEYDLDLFMIVAVDDFNMGAMENKGLNVFNSRFVLAHPETATDQDFASVEGVIAHEYFHNWTGNRVTCRDWFQLSLKEGLTVFRDQQFSADTGSPAVKRIQDVRLLRTHQFPEDAGPMAHPVRPDAYIEISNFYTVTVYNKGAEVVRMIHTLLGADAFRSGMDLYLRRHDGEAVTTEEFVRAMEDASGVDLGQFRRWYGQAGTPEIEVRGEHLPDTAEYLLHLEQHTPPTPGQRDKEPLHVPLRLALVGPDGGDLPLACDAWEGAPAEAVASLTERRQTLRFRGVPAPPVPSVGRGFSAPVKITMERSDADLVFLAGNDGDPFNRWDAVQTLATSLLRRAIDAVREGRAPEIPATFLDALRATLTDRELDRALIAEALTLPSERYLADHVERIDPDAIHAAREAVRLAIANGLAAELRATYLATTGNEPYRFDAASAGRRGLKNLSLSYLVKLRDEESLARCVRQFDGADNMTDALAALACLAAVSCPERDEALARFHDRWRAEPLVLDKWLTLQATSPLPGTLDAVRGLTAHPAFDARNPNRIRALVGAFAHGNQLRFHDASGEGHRFVGEWVLDLDRRNPQIAARLVGAFGRWRRFDSARRASMRAELERILAAPGLSKDTYEVASKTLA